MCAPARLLLLSIPLQNPFHTHGVFRSIGMLASASVEKVEKALWTAEAQQPLLRGCAATAGSTAARRGLRQAYSAESIASMSLARDRIAARSAVLVGDARQAVAGGRHDARAGPMIAARGGAGSVSADAESVESGSSSDESSVGGSDDEQHQNAAAAGGDRESAAGGDVDDGDGVGASVTAHAAVVARAGPGVEGPSALSFDTVTLPEALPNPRTRVFAMPPSVTADLGLCFMSHLVAARTFAVEVIECADAARAKSPCTSWCKCHVAAASPGSTMVIGLAFAWGVHERESAVLLLPPAPFIGRASKSNLKNMAAMLPPAVLSRIFGFLDCSRDVLSWWTPHVARRRVDSVRLVCANWRRVFNEQLAASHAAVVPARWEAVAALLSRPSLEVRARN